MTAATLATPTPLTTAGRVTFPGVLRSEWTKLTSLRSTWWTSAAAVVIVVGIGLLVAFDRATDATARPDAFEFTAGSLLGSIFAQLVLAVLAALMITGEYSTGMIRSSMTSVPRRLPVLAAKSVVFAAFVVPLTVVTNVVTFLLAHVIATSNDQVPPSLFDGDVLRVVLGGPLTILLAGLIALGLGVLIRSTAGTVAAAVALFFVVPIVAIALPSSLHGFIPYLPTNAGGSLTGLSIASTGQDDLAPGVGIAVMAAWAVVALVAAAWRLRRSDV